MTAIAKEYPAFEAQRTSVVAISVDTPEESRSLLERLALPFPILCDVNREVIARWDILNTKERGGIAYPHVFILDQRGTLVFFSQDNTTSRVEVQPLLDFLQQHRQDHRLRAHNHERKFARPVLKDVLMVIPRMFGWSKQ